MYRKNKQKKQIKRQPKKQRRTLILGTVVAITVVVGLFLWYHADHQKKAVSTPPASTTTTTVTPTNITQSTTPTPNPNVPGGITTGNPPGQVDLVSPSGDLVSNHSPSLTPGDPRSEEESVCNTTVGATCDISFTNGGQTVSLGTLTVTATKDTGTGAASWTWTPESINLTAGTWKITATAQLDGQTKTTTDATPLTVSP